MQIKIDQLSNEITKAIQAYTDDVSKAIEEKVDEVAQAVLGDVVRNAPANTGKYARGFKITGRDEQGKTRRVIWNKRHYKRVHLLEFPHVTRLGTGKGKPKEGGKATVAARPHLRPAYDKHGAKLPDDIKKIIRDGG